MRPTLAGLVLAFSLCASPVAQAQSASFAPGAPDSAAVAGEIAALEQRWARALIEQDTATLDRLLAPQFALSVSTAPQRPLPRAAWLASLPAYETRALEVCGLHVRVVEGVAIASFVAHLEASFQGADRSGEFFITDVWIQRDGRWQVAARYSSKPEGNTASARALAGEARTACGKPDDSQAAEELIELDERLTDASVRKDEAALEGIYSDDFILVNRKGEVWNKKRNIDFLTSEGLEFQSMTTEHHSVEVFGETAQMYHWGSAKGARDGRAFSGRGRTFHIFVRRSGRWQILLTHEGVSNNK